MPSKAKFYQWPNIVSVDAAMIAVAWQYALAEKLWVILEWPAYAVLGISVWLTYMADRLYDVASRPMKQLQSLRHQFAKKHRSRLWQIWWGALMLNLAIATQLSSQQLQRGAILLGICLLYTYFNQKLSRRFFPKEICVALIYAGGIIVFIPTTPIIPMLSLAWLCLINCLIIGTREKRVDADMQVNSITSIPTERYIAPLAFLSTPIMLWATPQLNLAMTLSLALLGILQLFQNRIQIEDFRVMADTTLMAGAIFALV